MMGTDVYEIFNGAVEKSVEILDDLLGNKKNYFDFDKFINALQEMDQEPRILSMARAIIMSQANEPEYFLSLVRSMIDEEMQTTIIQHDYNNFNMSGNLPENAELIIRGVE